MPSQAVAPTRTDPEYPAGPTLPPYNVTLIDPVAPLLALKTRLARSKSPDTPRDKLPPRIPMVTAARLDWADMRLSLHCTLLSDVQSVPSHAVGPTRGRPEVAASPAPAPCSVILVEPVAPLLTPLTPLAIKPSTEKLLLTLPTPNALETSSPRLIIAPYPT